MEVTILFDAVPPDTSDCEQDGSLQNVATGRGAEMASARETEADRAMPDSDNDGVSRIVKEFHGWLFKKNNLTSGSTV